MKPLLGTLFVAAVLLLADAKARAIEEEEEEEDAVLAALKECSENIKPSDDDLNEISKGDLKSDPSKAIITCWFKGAGVMQDRLFQSDKAVIFLRAITPRDPKKDNVDLMKKLADKCASSVNSETKDKASDTEAAVIIYNCMVKEGRAMRLTLEEGNSQGNATAPT